MLVTEEFDETAPAVSPDASQYAAWAHELRGDDVAAQAAFDSARLMLDSVLAVLPDDWRGHAPPGRALAGVGERPETLRGGPRAQQAGG